MTKTLKMKRRGFLGALVASPFAAKKTAKDIINQETMALTGVPVGSRPIGAEAPFPVNEKSMAKAAVWELLGKKIPDFKMAELKRDASYISFIHPGIATLRSVSTTSKFNMQRQSNLNKAVEHVEREFTSSLLDQREAFKNKFGWWL